MERYEYHEMMNDYCNKYDVTMNYFIRERMISFHETVLEDAPFELLCKQMALDLMCERLRPGMRLYERTYSLYSQN